MRSNSGRGQDKPVIHLHVGAHKTATTYIQAQLSQNAETLAERGIANVPMRAFRSWRRSLVRLGARFGGSPQVKFDRRLHDWNAARCETCIISDENMIGTCGDIVSSGSLYPKLRAKLGTVAAATSGHEVGIFMAIRSYASFYAAAYGEALRYGSGCGFEAFKQRLAPSARRWRDVLDDIASVFPASPIVVWPYESFRQSQAEIFDALTGKKIASKLHLSGEVLRPSLSQDTVNRVQKIGSRFGWSVAGYAVPIVELRAAGVAPFDPWNEAERVELEQLYAGDLEEIGLNRRYRVIGRGYESGVRELIR